MAELYLATPVAPAHSPPVVVLKRVLPAFSSSSNFARMFAREARLASMLRHPNIVEVHGTDGLSAQDCFFTMEYVHGVDLGVLLDAVRNRGGTIPLAHALTIAVAMCGGLHHAHDATGPDGTPLGIVHRDVSPSNVLLGFDGSIKVTDFGVAKALAMTRLTEEGTRKGKLSYMSPEQAMGETVDRRADVFAIATVLYELTTMERLFGGDNDLAVMYNILHRERPSPRQSNPGYPAALEAIVLQAVARELDERYPTAAALGADLEGFAADVGLELSPTALAAFVAQTVPARVHPLEDPTFRTSATSLRSAPQHQVTVAEAPGEEGTAGGSSTAHVTGPQRATPSGPVHVGASLGPQTGATAISNPGPLHGPSVSHPAMARGSQPWSTTAPPTSASPSRLRMWSIALAMVAVVVATTMGVVVWRANRDPAPPPATKPVAADPASIQAAPVAPPAAQPTPAVSQTPTTPAVAPPSEPAAAAAEPTTPPAATNSTRRRPKRTKKKPRAPAPAPTPTPTTTPDEPKPSKKPSPTDTLLPILE